MGYEGAVTKSSGGGGECIHCICHLLLPARRALLPFAPHHVGVLPLQNFVEGKGSVGEVVLLIPTSSTQRSGYAGANGAETCAEAVASPDILPKQ